MGAVDEILEWSTTKLAPWRQDALRRLAGAAALATDDHHQLMSLVKAKAGFPIAVQPPAPIPLAKAHLTAVAGGAPLRIKSVGNVSNVNRLIPSAALSFAPDGLTIVYGRNGSGKSGFARIFRTACRTRTENPAKLKILADVYGPSQGPQAADIVIDLGSGDVTVPWTAGGPASDVLLQVAVFDSSAAQVYVDNGNHVQFLPFGLALPHKLNDLCIALKERLDSERTTVSSQLALANVSFAQQRQTEAQTFCFKVTSVTSDPEIDAAVAFTPGNETRLTELTRLLAASAASAADLTALSAWIDAVAAECTTLNAIFGDAGLEAYRALKQAALDARTAAGMSAVDMFSDEPLSGVGSEAWRLLWLAARNFSIADAFPGQQFPVVSTAEQEALCVLCQQPLDANASARLTQFQAFVGGSLAQAAETAEAAVALSAKEMPRIELLVSKDWDGRLEQVRKRDEAAAVALVSFKANISTRRASAVAALAGKAEVAPAALTLSVVALETMSASLKIEAAALANADDVAERAKLVSEHAELTDRKALAAARGQIIKRRDLLREDALYAKAISEVGTTGITKKANELIDTHLTAAVSERFSEERQALDITHLKVGLLRKSGQTKATFQTNPGTTLTKLTSDILSEGEQRALALAAFLTEVGVTEGSGPIVVDDPVSSLDRDRGLRVAARLAAEAQKRQVIVLTHDLVFYNDLCKEADDRGVETKTIALFANGTNAGLVDPAGVSWKGLSVSKRLGQIKNDFAPIAKLHGTSPTDYEYKVKHLYGRLRDSYERLVEEFIFCDVVRRGVDRIETQKLRMVHLSDALAIRFGEGMTKANTHSHDNPAADTVAVPLPAEFQADLAFIEQLMADLKAESVLAESKRPSMKPKKD